MPSASDATEEYVLSAKYTVPFATISKENPLSTRYTPPLPSIMLAAANENSVGGESVVAREGGREMDRGRDEEREKER